MKVLTADEAVDAAYNPQEVFDNNKSYFLVFCGVILLGVAGFSFFNKSEQDEEAQRSSRYLEASAGMEGAEEALFLPFQMIIKILWEDWLNTKPQSSNIRTSVMRRPPKTLKTAGLSRQSFAGKSPVGICGVCNKNWRRFGGRQKSSTISFREFKLTSNRSSGGKFSDGSAGTC